MPRTAATPGGPPRKPVRVRGARIATALAAALIASGCGGPPVAVETTPDQRRVGGAGASGRPPRVLLVGIDGAEWSLIDRLASRGGLPNFARLIEGGARGDMETLPEMGSPAIWTSVLTGRTPEEHGIPAWTVPGPDGEPLLVTSNMRRKPTVWEILNASGLEASLVGWIATWPATPLDGSLVTSYMPLTETRESPFDKIANPKKGALWEMIPQQTWPPDLLQDLLPLRLTPQDVTDEDLARFLPPPDGEIPPREESLRRSLRFVYAADTSFGRIAETLFSRERVALQAVYFGGVDAVSHRFWHFMDPSRVPATETERERFGGVIPGYYAYADEWLGRLLALMDDDTTLIVCSDHGFQADRPKKNVRQISGRHRDVAVLIFSGRGVRPGVRIEGASIYDLTPTILALLGLHPAADMPGRVLTEAFDGSLTPAGEGERVASYDHLLAAPAEEGPVGSPVDDQLIEQLRSLGYIQ